MKTIDFLKRRLFFGHEDDQIRTLTPRIIIEWLDEHSAESLTALTKEHDAEMKELKRLLLSESVGRLLRFATKSPSRSGMDDCEDDCYYDLYNLVNDPKFRETKRKEIIK